MLGGRPQHHVERRQALLFDAEIGDQVDVGAEDFERLRIDDQRGLSVPPAVGRFDVIVLANGLAGAGVGTILRGGDRWRGQGSQRPQAQQHVHTADGHSHKRSQPRRIQRLTVYSPAVADHALEGGRLCLLGEQTQQGYQICYRRMPHESLRPSRPRTSIPQQPGGVA
jgi:hypothetical protein